MSVSNVSSLMTEQPFGVLFLRWKGFEFAGLGRAGGYRTEAKAEKGGSASPLSPSGDILEALWPEPLGLRKLALWKGLSFDEALLESGISEWIRGSGIAVLGTNVKSFKT